MFEIEHFKFEISNLKSREREFDLALGRLKKEQKLLKTQLCDKGAQGTTWLPKLFDLGMRFLPRTRCVSLERR